MLRRVLLSVAVVLALTSVPVAADVGLTGSDRSSTAGPLESPVPQADLDRDALRQSTPVMTVSNAIRRILLRLTLFFATIAVVVAASAVLGRPSRRAIRSPLRRGRAWVAPATRAPPVFA